MDDDAVRTLGVPLLVGVDVGDAVAFVSPTGTVTFLLTDLEGSSRGWEDSPETMAIAVARH